MDRDTVLNGFLKEFGGSSGDVRVFFAPLRVNLIGEYTDIAGGLVLPCALNYGIFAAARARGDRLSRLATANDRLAVTVNMDILEYERADGWANYPKGVFYELTKAGHDISGVDIYFAADAELSACGLSSSAAIEVLTGEVMRGLFGLRLDGVSLALLAQRAENGFVGVMCGIMDQFAVCMGKAGHAILLDCGTLDFEYIPACPEDFGMKLIIMNTNRKRGLLDSKYNERRSEAEQALSGLMSGGVIERGGCLCSIGEAELAANERLISSLDARKRARHLVSENGRVRRAADALLEGDYPGFGQLLCESHLSLKDDFEVTGKELDAIVEAALFAEGCCGARMTGAGFGGCAIALVSESAVPGFIELVSERYSAETGLRADFYLCGAGAGAREV